VGGQARRIFQPFEAQAVVTKKVGCRIAFGDVPRQQLAKPLAAALLESLVSQGGLLLRDWELPQRPGAVNLDFARPKGLDQLRYDIRTEYLLHLCHVAGGYTSEGGNLLPAVDPSIFCQF
jgi:hypothetical protein